MSYEDLKKMADRAHIGMALHGTNALTGGPVDRLPPRLWEDFRVELQRRYRKATGEEFAVLSVDVAPAPPQPNAVGMDEDDRTPVPQGFDVARWQRADEAHHAMALVADDAECVKILYAALAATEGSADAG